MNLFETTTAYEKWLHQQVPVVAADLAEKHQKMAKSSFSFLRATFYWWVPRWLALCPRLAEAPQVLAVGDLHVENFGTWRDAEGRLAWGVNDFDEAAPMPYTLDLVRLTTSALVARKEHRLKISEKAACAAILHGYQEQMRRGGDPFVLEEEYAPLRDAALSTERDPVTYWEKLNALRTTKAPRDIQKLLTARLPRNVENVRIVHRTSGAGSLGRPRYVALATWNGAFVAREAKAMLPSAYGWAQGRVPKKLYCADLNRIALRSHDPFSNLDGRWLMRRLGPRCSRIELNMLPASCDVAYLLEAMGRETANVHLGSHANIKSVRAHLSRLPKDWLIGASQAMADAMLEDWAAWKSAR